MLTQTTFFFGIVEDNNDPLQLGRVRVRAYGYHTENKQLIPTETLPWSPVVISNSSGVSGVGYSATGIVPGSFVFGAFTDSDLQNSVVLGSIHTNPAQSANPQLGFNDPSGTFPKYIGESDVAKLARGEDTLNTTPVWKEPESAYAAKYPHNQVYQSVSGHAYEFDDTPGAERIRLWHKSGSFFEYHPDGKLVDRVRSDRYTITLGNRSEFVNSDLLVEIAKSVTYKVGGSYDLTIGGEFNIGASVVKIKSTVEIEDELKVGTNAEVKGVLKAASIDAQFIKTKSIIAAGGSVGSSTVKELFVSPKSKVPLTVDNVGRNDPNIDRVEISDMATNSITDSDGNWFTKTDEVSYSAKNKDAIKNKALVGVQSLSTYENGLAFYTNTGNVNEDMAGQEDPETGNIYDALGQEFKLAPINSSGGIELDGGEF